MSSLPELRRRLSRALETGRGIQLTPAELDLWVVTGAYSAFSRAVDEYQEKQCQQRNARSRSISEVISPFTSDQVAIMKSSGTTVNGDVSEARARVHAILKKPG